VEQLLYCLPSEYVPESFVNAREREFDNLVQGTMSVGQYARRFSSLLAYVPHVSGHERAKRNKFLEGLNEELYSLVLAGSPTSYVDAVDKAMDIEEGLQNSTSLLAYVPHVSGHERAKRNKFLEGLNEELYSLVLAGSPTSYVDAVDKAMDIEEGLQNSRSRVRPQVVQGNHPMVSGLQPTQSVQSSKPPQQQVDQ
ncbi:hypothetical protein F511_13875, partial [Dorcoceras hygrometricum]